MTVYVPLTFIDIVAIRNARRALLSNAEIGDTIAYYDCIRLDDIVDAFENLQSFDGTIGTASTLQATAPIADRADDLAVRSGAIDRGGPRLTLARPAHNNGNELWNG